MLSPNIFRTPPIPYHPLPKNAHDAARDSFISIGFAKEAIFDDYSFSTQKGETVKINALASAHPKHRTPTAEYAGFTVYNAQNGLDDQGIVRTLAYSAAPFHLIHRDGRFSFWGSNVQDSQIQPISIQRNVAYDQLDNMLRKYEVDLKPHRIVDVKQGRSKFRYPLFAEQLHPLQLSMWAANVTRPLLVKHFGTAVNDLRYHLDSEETTVNIATQLLGAIILADTGGLGDTLRLNDQYGLDSLIEAANARFPTYFERELFERYADIAKQAYAILRQVRYVGFSPEMLTEIYTAAYDKAQRKKLGRYDTPLYLTQRIWENIPIEFLPPDQRVTVDMTCGWGSFLLAGHERLSGLTDMQNTSLRKYLHGNDADYLTSQLAGLGLLLSTSEDSWHVDHDDAVKWAWLDQNQPNVIVGNPPFEGDRRKSVPDRKKRYQKADQFLRYAIDRLAPNGYLAMLMPQSFGVVEASPQLRKHLLETCDVLELWELPIAIFPDATAGTMVIFAQKRNDKVRKLQTTPVRVRTIQKQTKESFEQSSIFTSSSVVSDQSVWNENLRRSKNSKNTHLITYRLILSELVWQEIRSHCVDLQERAIVFQGAIEGRPDRWRWKDYPNPKKVPWLVGAQNIVPRRFYIAYDNASTIIYPNELEEPRKNKRSPEEDREKYLLGPKILLTSNQNPSWGRRITIAIEDKGGYCVSNSFWVIAPNKELDAPHLSLEVIAAIINWKVSNAWVIEHLKYTKLNDFAVKYIPFPRNLSKEDCQALTWAVRKIETTAMANTPEPAEANQTIDAILKAAYQLDDETYNRLTMIYEWDENPRITLDPPYPAPEATWIISGVVEKIDAQEGNITLWLDGFDHFETVPITPVMPGWLLRPDVAFRTTIPRKYVRKQTLANIAWGKFYPQEYTYLSEEDLFDQLTHAFYPEAETL